MSIQSSRRKGSGLDSVISASRKQYGILVDFPTGENAYIFSSGTRQGFADTARDLYIIDFLDNDFCVPVGVVVEAFLREFEEDFIYTTSEIEQIWEKMRLSFSKRKYKK